MLIKCVPNISEGRDLEKVRRIVAALEAVSAVKVLHVDSGFDANRTVITFVGNNEAVQEGAVQLIKASAQEIDMRTHGGIHTRIGATDVCPFVPIGQSSLEECREIAWRVGKRVAAELALPVYFYGEAAKVDWRKKLSAIRRGGYEALMKRQEQSKWQPDCGPAEPNQQFGAVAIGARPILVAYNVNLNTPNATIAREIAEKIRSSSGGLLSSCQAVGWYCESFGCAQVSCNLTNYRETGLQDVYFACKKLAEDQGVEVTGSELVGLAPSEALIAAGRALTGGEQLSTDGYLKEAIDGLGLNAVRDFKPEEQLLESSMRAQSISI